jgi:hypothetical protein
MTRWIPVLVLFDLALCACASTYVEPADPIPISGNEIIGINGACLTVQDGQTADGTPIVLSQCASSPNQEWFIRNGQIEESVGGCLDVLGGGSTESAPIIIHACNGTPSQHWRVSKSQIVGIGAKCVDVTGGGAVTQIPLILSTCSNAPSQMWTVQFSRASSP